MDSQTLFQWLQQGYNSTLKSLSVDVTGLNDSTLTNFMNSYLPSTSIELLTLTTTFPPQPSENGQYSFTGTGNYYGVSTAGIIFQVMLDASQNPQLSLTIPLPYNWTFGQSFISLAPSIISTVGVNTEKTDQMLILSSQTIQSIIPPILLNTGLQLYGSLDLAVPLLDGAQWMFTFSSPATGMISFETDASGGLQTMMDITLASGDIPNLFDVETVSGSVSLWAGIGDFGYYQAGLQVTGGITVAGNPLTMTGLMSTLPMGVLVIDGAFATPITISSLSQSDFTSFTGNIPDLLSLIPSIISKEVSLAGFHLGIGSTTKQVEYLGIGFQIAQGKTWDICTDISLGGVLFSPTVFQPMSSPQMYFIFKASLELFGIPLSIFGRIPDLQLSGELDLTQPLPSVASIVSAIDSAIDVSSLDELYLNDLDFIADAHNDNYQLSVGVEGTWQPVSSLDWFIVNDLKFEVTSDSGVRGFSIAGTFTV